MRLVRWSVLSVLIRKEGLRLVANRGGLVLVLLLVTAALLLAVLGDRVWPADEGPRCFIDYAAEGPWIDHLRTHVPRELRGQIEFRPADRVPTVDGVIVYPQGV